MRLGWLNTTFRATVILLLIAAILGVTTATLFPAIYRSDWFQNRYVNPAK